MSTRTSRPTRPQRWARWAAAAAPVPQASVTPAPRSHTSRSRVSGPSPALMNSTFTPVGNCCSIQLPVPTRSTSARSRTSTTRCGLPMSAVAWRASASRSETAVGDVGSVADRAHGDVDLGQAVIGVVVDDELPEAAVGGHEVGRLVVVAGHGQGLAQAADAVAAHLGPAAVGVPEVHHHVDRPSVGRGLPGRRARADDAARRRRGPGGGRTGCGPGWRRRGAGR